MSKSTIAHGQRIEVTLIQTLKEWHVSGSMRMLHWTFVCLGAPHLGKWRVQSNFCKNSRFPAPEEQVWEMPKGKKAKGAFMKALREAIEDEVRIPVAPFHTELIEESLDKTGGK